MQTLSRPKLEVNYQGIILARMPRKVGTPLPAHVAERLAQRPAQSYGKPVSSRKAVRNG